MSCLFRFYLRAGEFSLRIENVYVPSFFIYIIYELFFNRTTLRPQPRTTPPPAVPPVDNYLPPPSQSEYGGFDLRTQKNL